MTFALAGHSCGLRQAHGDTNFRHLRHVCLAASNPRRAETPRPKPYSWQKLQGTNERKVSLAPETGTNNLSSIRARRLRQLYQEQDIGKDADRYSGSEATPDSLAAAGPALDRARLDEEDDEEPDLLPGGAVNWGKKYKFGTRTVTLEPAYGPDAPARSSYVAAEEQELIEKGEKPQWVRYSPLSLEPHPQQQPYHA